MSFQVSRLNWGGGGYGMTQQEHNKIIAESEFNENQIERGKYE